MAGLPSVWSLSLDAIYASTIGTDAVFTAFAGTVRVIDKTVGIEVAPVQGGPAMPTALPAAMVRASTLEAKGVLPGALIGSLVTLNKVTWKIINTEPAPQPDGEAGGEYRLTLRKPS